ncbi:MAG: CUB domain-containing protein, partial [Bacteroidota bacterium]
MNPTRQITWILLLLFACQTLTAQNDKEQYNTFFEEAYQRYPTIPPGLLEAVAFTNTRMKHIDPDPSCQGLPVFYGVMGLVEDGKGYFENSLLKVSQLSGFSVEQIKKDPRSNIMAYAAAYAALQRNKRLNTRSVENHGNILAELSEIPQDNSNLNAYARDQQFYSVLREMQEPHTNSKFRTRRLLDVKKVFGEEKYRVLSAPGVRIEGDRIQGADGTEFQNRSLNRRTATCTDQNQETDFPGALWSRAHPNNYGSRNGADIKYVTIHTIQGSYSSAISWFRNSRARVSAHYIIRASDGQITQMVCEKDKGFHVRTDNSEAIGIEHEGFIAEGASWYTNEMYEASAALVRDICRRNNINPLGTFAGPPTSGVLEVPNACRRIKGHQHFRGNDHIDPGPYWDWDRYYRLINAAPAPKEFTANRGTILDSGGKNGKYGPMERLTYLIKPKKAGSIKLTFPQFELEEQDPTKKYPFDFMDIYDGENIFGKYIGRFQGKKNPGQLFAESGSVYIEFRSDCGDQHAGYEIKYESTGETGSCPAPQSMLASNVAPMHATLSWDAAPGISQYIMRLRRRLDNKWATFPTNQTATTITGLSASTLYQWQLMSVCGGDSSAVMGSTFITPSPSRTSAPGNFTVTSQTGRFNDTGGSLAGYANEESFIYRIIPDNGGRVELTFSSFATEEKFDVLTIYDGPDTTGRKLGSFSGNQRPPRILSTGNGLTLRFTSDKRTTATGWTSSWRTVGGSTKPPVANNGG